MSLYPYARVLERMYLQRGQGGRFQLESPALLGAICLLGLGTIATGVLPESWLEAVTQATAVQGMRGR